MAFRKIKGSFKNRDITTHVLEDTYLAHDTVTGQLRIGDGVTPGGSLVAGGSATGLKFGDTSSATISISDGGGAGAFVLCGCLLYTSPSPRDRG